MRTRNASQTALAGDLPVCVQDHLLSIVTEQHAAVDTADLSWYPYPSSFAWLTTLQRVCKHWQSRLLHNPSYLRRARLESLNRVGQLHDYAYLIRTESKSRAARRKKLPKTFELIFASGVITCSTGKPAPTVRADLPQDCLVVTARGNDLSPAVLLDMLLDQAYLDQQRCTAYVLHVACAPGADLTASRLPSKQQSQLKRLLATMDLQSITAFDAVAEAAPQAGASNSSSSSSSSSSQVADLIQATLLAAQHHAAALLASTTTSSTMAAVAAAAAAVPDAAAGTTPHRHLAVLQRTAMEVRKDGVYFIPTSEVFRRARPDSQQ